MLKAYIRGIYSTALSKLIVDHGGKLYNPSQVIRKRLGYSEEINEFNISIMDRNSFQGIRGFGEVEAVEELRDLLFEKLLDVVFWIKGKSGKLCTFKVEFPYFSKRKLDEIRSSVCPTLMGHHYAKAYGPPLSTMVEEAEKKLEMGVDIDKEGYERKVECCKLPSSVEIAHMKLNGNLILLGNGKVESDSWPIRITRKVISYGTYDGLGIEKEVGDVIVTEFEEASFYYKTTYYSKEGEIKGYYYNICTPVEIYKNGVRYVDLEVDIVALPSSIPQLIDEDLLDQAVEKRIISEKLANVVKKESSGLIDKLVKELLHS